MKEYLNPNAGDSHQRRFASALAEFLTSRPQATATTDDIRVALQTAAAIEWLRAEEADSVIILCTNPDPDTIEQQCAVECCGFWTGLEERRYYGQTLLDALDAACLARETIEKNSRPGGSR